MKKKVRFLEEIASNGHVALNVVQYDGWLLRFSNGYTGRANSVSPLYPSKLPLEEKVAYCEECYAKQGLPANFKLTEYDTVLSDFLAQRGYKKANASDLMVLDKLEKATEGFSPRSCMLAKTPEEWLPDYFRLEKITDKADQETFCKMLDKVMADTVYVSLYYEDKTVACGSAAIEHGYALIQNIIVNDNFRGKGYGEKLCRTLLKRAQELGAKHAYLQVVQTNTAAKNLYTKLGFKKEYSYWYMKK